MLDDHLGTLTQLQATLAERSNSLVKETLNLPILDVFGVRLKPEQIWLPQLTQPNGSFPNVARFDRCTTCHYGISKTAAGSSIDPAYPKATEFAVHIPTAKREKKELADWQKAVQKTNGDWKQQNQLLLQTFGLMLAEEGLLKPNEPTISVIVPETPAAKADLSMGDVITYIGTANILSRDQAFNNLLDNIDWGKDLIITVRRGVPQPYCSHPRMELFVGSMSPHPVEKFGCTICHQGNGSATEFKWTSHTPNNELQERQWAEKYGWFNNHHWIFPMLSDRFKESSCLKCHHNVAELLPSDRFPDGPAPKLVQGYNTVREYGCFGCHEINGYDGPNKRVGPDLRNEPAFFAGCAATFNRC